MPGAYYNEFEPYCAEWLRNLIKAGLIPDGDVDDRSIRDVRPDDLRGYTQCHFFAGLGGWAYALRLAGWADDREVWTGSCPCQPFSAAGKRQGTSDDRHLWPEFYRLIAERRPSTIFGEQVASKDGLAWLDIVSTDLEDAGYAFGAADLCAAGVGAPHIRQRLWFVANAYGGNASAKWQQRSGQHGQQPEDCCARLGMGDAGRERGRRDAGTVFSSQGESTRERSGTRRVADEPVSSGTVNPLADADAQQFNRQWDGRPGRRAEFANGCGLGELADSNSQRFSERSERDGEPQQSKQQAPCGDDVSRCDTADELEHAASDGRQQRRPEPSGWRIIGGRGEGFWHGAEWLPCTDGKARPVEPGTFPLAHGIPARVAKLRALGNAIVPQVAAEFIRAAVDA